MVLLSKATWRTLLAALPEKLLFWKFPIDRQTVFLATEWSFAFTNLKPVIPGHVLVSPRRVVDRISMLTAEELSDLFSCAQLVGDIIMRAHPHADSLTFTVQDGVSAGQSVKHVHVHIMPRWAGDRFNSSEAGNDSVYAAINQSDAQVVKDALKVDESEQTMGRTPEEMMSESVNLRRHLAEILV
jgi:diadenosine tetraphosphate (Ap4A) HIT family hydrolase